MKLLTEYLERAVSLERLTANEPQSESKKSLLRQACISKVGGQARRGLRPAPPSPPEI